MLIVSCSDPATDAANIVATQPTSAYVVDYGNGVYLIPMTDRNFAVALSRFLEEHPELEVRALTATESASGTELRLLRGHRTRPFLQLTRRSSRPPSVFTPRVRRTGRLTISSVAFRHLSCGSSGCRLSDVGRQQRIGGYMFRSLPEFHEFGQGDALATLMFWFVGGGTIAIFVVDWVAMGAPTWWLGAMGLATIVAPILLMIFKAHVKLNREGQ